MYEEGSTAGDYAGNQPKQGSTQGPNHWTSGFETMGPALGCMVFQRDKKQVTRKSTKIGQHPHCFFPMSKSPSTLQAVEGVMDLGICVFRNTQLPKAPKVPGAVATRQSLAQSFRVAGCSSREAHSPECRSPEARCDSFGGARIKSKPVAGG